MHTCGFNLYPQDLTVGFELGLFSADYVSSNHDKDSTTSSFFYFRSSLKTVYVYQGPIQVKSSKSYFESVFVQTFITQAPVSFQPNMRKISQYL